MIWQHKRFTAAGPQRLLQNLQPAICPDFGEKVRWGLYNYAVMGIINFFIHIGGTRPNQTRWRDQNKREHHMSN